MKVSVELVKEIRARTGAGILECKDVLLEANGDLEKAIESLKQRGMAVAERKLGRAANEGIIESYIHYGGRIGAMVELNCETDFVARTDEFKELAHNLAMQVAATSPKFITAEEIPQGIEEDSQAVCLLLQPFIKDPSKDVHEVIKETIARVGENITVRRFARFELSC